MEMNYEAAFNLSSKINEEDEAKIKQLKDAMNEIIETRKALPYYATGIKVDMNLIAKTCDRMFEIAQKALEGK